MNIENICTLWQTFDKETQQELAAMEGNRAELLDRFGEELTFGTGGLRAKMGAGTNRMNQYTVARTTVGYALFLCSHYDKTALSRGVIIAYDSRRRAEEFAVIAGKILRSYGIPAFLFKEPTPTPILSFAVSRQNALGGIVVTASHNSKEYNGYKIYNAKGVQLIPEEASEIWRFIKTVKISPCLLPRETGDIPEIEEAVFHAYCAAVLREQRNPGAKRLRIVYSPLHGTGNRAMRFVLEKSGFSEIFPVAEQTLPNGDFPTVAVPNPEEPAAFTLSLSMGEKCGADLLLVTDPDCDRIGVAAAHKDGYQLLKGNEIAALLCAYLLNRYTEKEKIPYIITTIVSGTLAEAVARDYGAVVLRTLTGFKYIGAKALALEKNTASRFLFGYEESCGYLCGSHAKDKDAIVAAMLICEMAEDYKRQGLTLIDALERLYLKYGFRSEGVFSYTRKNAVGWQEEMMASFCRQGAALFDDATVLLDYSQGLGGLPPAEVLKYCFFDGSWLALRPSGTEPKLKVYCEFLGKNKAQALQRQREAMARVEALWKQR